MSLHPVYGSMIFFFPPAPTILGSSSHAVCIIISGLLLFAEMCVCVCVCPARASREGLDDLSWVLK
jgi:hypothetical protein